VLEMAAKFSARYLRNFYELNKEALDRHSDEPAAYIVPAGQPNAETVSRFLEVLMAQGIEVRRMTRELEVAEDADRKGFHEVPLGSFLVFVDQPQKNNVLSLFERQVYPNRVNANGEAEAPYDVAGWTLPLQMGVDVITAWDIKDLDKNSGTLKPVQSIGQARSVLDLPPTAEPFAKLPNPLKTDPKIGVYKGFTASMDEGWTRFVLDTFRIHFRSISDADVRGGKLDLDVVIIPSNSETSIVQGLSPGRYLAELTGGIGDAGLANLKKFVADGGELICFDSSCGMLIKLFDLPIQNVLAGLKRNEFYNPGSIVRIRVDTKSPLGNGMKEETAAYFVNSSAFQIGDTSKARSIATYAAKDALLSGWMLGEKYLNGRSAIVEADYGKGKVVLFAFRPQHRGQTWGTFPLIFNALEKR
jgi:hypothetical protein